MWYIYPNQLLVWLTSGFDAYWYCTLCTSILGAELYFVRVQLKGSDNILVGIEICPEYNTALVLVSPLLNDHGRVVKFANGLYVYINNCAVFAGIVKAGESTVNVPT